MEPPKSFQFRNRSLKIDEVHCNTSQEIIEITCDRVKLILNEHRAAFEDKKSWQTPLALVLSMLASIVTTDFKDSMGVQKCTWQAFFFMGLVLSVGWLLRAFWKLWRSPGISDIVNEMKKSPSGQKTQLSEFLRAITRGD